MPTGFTGGCACGAIHYESSADPVLAGHCQCRSCQRDSGTGHASHIGVPAVAMKITGTPNFWEKPADSGNIVSRGFCPTCGSPVMSKNSGMADMIFVRAASLDDPSLFEAAFVVYTSDAQPWDTIDQALPGFTHMPPMDISAEGDT